MLNVHSKYSMLNSFHQYSMLNALHQNSMLNVHNMFTRTCKGKWKERALGRQFQVERWDGFSRHQPWGVTGVPAYASLVERPPRTKSPNSMGQDTTPVGLLGHSIIYSNRLDPYMYNTLKRTTCMCMNYPTVCLLDYNSMYNREHPSTPACASPVVDGMSSSGSGIECK